MQVNILSGIYSSADADYRTKYPRNMVPIPLAQGISSGYLRPADGIKLFGVGPGIDRGAIKWNGSMYRVMGSSLVRIDADGSSTTLGDVGAGGQVRLDYSFDVLAIASAGSLYYWDGSTLAKVIDADLGLVVDMMWIAGYFMTTDGTNVVVTELTDRMAVNPLKYGSSEADPDRVVTIRKRKNEAYILNRYTVEVQDNVGGNNYPFQTVPGALTERGCIGRDACSIFLGSIAFVGSARNEAPAVWLMQGGETLKLSTREIDLILRDYTEDQLSGVVMEARADKAQQLLLIHLPDQTLVYDGAASLVVNQPIWHVATSSVVDLGTYRARNMVWCYDKWLAGDPTSSNIGELVSDVSSHYGAVNGWDFGTQVLYNGSNGAIVHEVELVGLTGRAALGINPTIWTSYSLDGVTWSQEKSISGGKQGDRTKRLQWRTQGDMENVRTQRFRGTSDFHGSFARLEVKLEPLNNG